MPGAVCQLVCTCLRGSVALLIKGEYLPDGTVDELDEPFLTLQKIGRKRYALNAVACESACESSLSVQYR